MNRNIFYSRSLLEQASQDLSLRSFRHLISILRYSGPTLKDCYPSRTTLQRLSGIAPKEQTSLENEIRENGYLEVRGRDSTTNLYSPKSPRSFDSGEMLSIPEQLLKEAFMEKDKAFIFFINLASWLSRKAEASIECSCKHIAKAIGTSSRTACRYIRNLLQSGALLGQVLKNVGVRIRNVFVFFMPEVRQKTSRCAKKAKPIPLAGEPKTPIEEEYKRIAKEEQTELPESGDVDSSNSVCSFLDKYTKLSNSNKIMLSRRHSEEDLIEAIEVANETYGPKWDNLYNPIGFIKKAIAEKYRSSKYINIECLKEAENQFKPHGIKLTQEPKFLTLSYRETSVQLNVSVGSNPGKFRALVMSAVSRMCSHAIASKKEAIIRLHKEAEEERKSVENAKTNLDWLMSSGILYRHNQSLLRVYPNSRGAGVFLGHPARDFIREIEEATGN
jgi:hypothetical protein